MDTQAIDNAKDAPSSKGIVHTPVLEKTETHICNPLPHHCKSEYLVTNPKEQDVLAKIMNYFLLKKQSKRSGMDYLN